MLKSKNNNSCDNIIPKHKQSSKISITINSEFLKKKDAKFILDSGCSINIIRKSLIRNNIPIIRDTIFNLYGFTSNEFVKTEGRISILLFNKRLSFEIQFHIIPDEEFRIENADGILGMEFLIFTKIDFTTNKLYLTKRNVCFPLSNIVNSNQHFITLQPSLISSLENKYIYSIYDTSESKPKDYTNINIRSEYILNAIKISHIPPNLLNQIKELIKSFSNIFYCPDDKLKTIKGYVHKVELLDKKPIFIRPFYANQNVENRIAFHIDQLLKQNVIEEIPFSAYNFPIFLLKKDNKERLVFDMHNLNKILAPSSIVHPKCDELIHNLFGARYFSTLDWYKAYHQIELDKNDRKYFSFTFKNTVYCLKRIGFGLQDGSVALIRISNTIFKDLLNKNIIIYFDDLIVFSTTLEEHYNILKEVFSRLQKFNITLNPMKCSFFSTFVNFVGYQISHNTISPNPDRISAVLNIPYPKNVKQLRSALGFFNFFRKLIPNYALITLNLYNLLKKDVKFIFSKVHEDEFDNVKKILTSKPILSIPNFNQPFIITTDASSKAISSILSQFYDNKQRIISYNSRALDKNEQSLSAFELELLAVCESICINYKKFIACSQILCYTDNIAVIYFLNSKLDCASSKAIRLKIKLLQYKFKLIHIPGNKNISDYLSRCLETPEDKIIISDNDNETINSLFPSIAQIQINNDQILAITRAQSKSNIINTSIEYDKFLKEFSEQTKNLRAKFIKHENIDFKPCKNFYNVIFTSNFRHNLPKEFSSRIANLSLPHLEPVVFEKNILISYKNNVHDVIDKKDFFTALINLRKMLRDLKIFNVRIFFFYDATINMYILQDMLKFIFKLDKINFSIVRENPIRIIDNEQKQEIIKSIHENILNAHSNFQKTMRKIKKLYIWQGMNKDIEKVVKSCAVCQLSQKTNFPKNPLQLTPNYSACNDAIFIDLIGTLTITPRSNRWIIVIIDAFSRFLTTIPISDSSAENIAKNYIKYHLLIFGPSKIILTDNASYFKSSLISQIMALLGTKHKTSTPYYAPGHSLVERPIRSIKYTLRTLLDDKLDNWDLHLPYVTYSLNTSIHESTGFTPYQLRYGHPHREIFNNLQEPDKIYSYDDYYHNLRYVLQRLSIDANHRNSQAKLKQKEVWDDKAKSWDIKEGDLVKILKPFKTNALEHPFIGPFKVIKVNTDAVVTILKDSKEIKINKNRLRPFYILNSSDEE